MTYSDWLYFYLPSAHFFVCRPLWWKLTVGIRSLASEPCHVSRCHSPFSYRFARRNKKRLGFLGGSFTVDDCNAVSVFLLTLKCFLTRSCSLLLNGTYMALKVNLKCSSSWIIPPRWLLAIDYSSPATTSYSGHYTCFLQTVYNFFFENYPYSH